MLRRIPATHALSMLLALVLAGCAAATAPTATLAPTIEPVTSPTQAPTSIASLTPSATPLPSALAPVPPASQRAPSPAAAHRVVDAAREVIEAGTMRFEVRGHAEGPAVDDPSATARGGASFGERRRFWVAIDADPETRRPSRDVIVDGEQAYLREGDSPHMPDGAWLVLELPDDTLGWRSIVRTYGDPRLIIAPILGVVSATPGGTESIGGSVAERFRVRIDPGRILEALPAHLRDAWERQQADMPGAGPADWSDTEVWIGPDGHVVRMRYALATKDLELFEITVTYDFDGIGEPIEVAPGPGEEVLTLEEATARYEAFVASPPPAAP